MNQTKYVFVTGGVASSLGKGIISASLGNLLKARGFRVAIQKLDPYINVDPGTLNPYEHGECYVTEDGAETDLDLGHYERFLNDPTSMRNNVTTGKIYKSVIEKERRGDFLGKTVQVIPHITDEIQYWIKTLAKNGNYDFVITEIGGTVGDIESLPYIEAVRQMKWELDDRCVSIHLTLVPYLKAAGELKTKPTQHSVKTLLEQGLQPDIIVCRTELDLDNSIKRKIALFCNVSETAVIQSIDADTIYRVPLQMRDEGLDIEVLKKTKCTNYPEPDMKEWKDFLNRLDNPKHEVNVALVGKYTELKDAYKSILEAFTHAGATQLCNVNVHRISSELFEENNPEDLLAGMDAVLVAPGFGERGIEGKINTIKYVRENNIPFLGICLGMQCAVIEFARNVIGMKGAHSTEINPNAECPVIDIMEMQKKIAGLGGTMRLGNYDCHLIDGTVAHSVYNEDNIKERHRHRYEFNNDYKNDFLNKGMIFSGINEKDNLVEIIELPNHPWFVGVQFHPEYKSTVLSPHPLFVGFIKAAIENKNK
ncbi:CTP synthase [Bacteroidales bacterium OttesenSCG-928-K03]|nr:CTP synthase [Odoribacter sp. OttesenSCG-928-L07]MDL2239727.1 CTP synthase [Bacteroidales bacterium OttesenSCG-928-L14]MDL2242955.1 CTP synthase [Bacteroidales bacterium OttesenSCG-928-K03]